MIVNNANLDCRFVENLEKTHEALACISKQLGDLRKDVEPILDDLRGRQRSEEEISKLRAKRDEIRQMEVDRQRCEWQANLAVVKERQAELDALERPNQNVGKSVFRLLVAIMVWSFPVALIAAGFGAIPPENQAFIFAGTAVMALGGLAVFIWETSNEAWK